MTRPNAVTIRPATITDTSVIHRLITGLAEYERLADQVTMTEANLRESLFGANPAAEVIIAECDGIPSGFALFFHNYSTFLGKRGIWLEDLFVEPAFRGRGVGKQLLVRLAAIARERQRRSCVLRVRASFTKWT